MLRYWKRFIVSILSMICFLLTMLSAALGEPAQQADPLKQAQADVQSIPQAGFEPKVLSEAQSGDINEPEATQSPVASEPAAPATTEAVTPAAADAVPPPTMVDAPSKRMEAGAGSAVEPPKATAHPVKQVEQSAPTAIEEKDKPSPAAVKDTGTHKSPAPKVKPAPTQPAKRDSKPKEQPEKQDGGLISRIVSATRGLVSRAVSWLGTRYIWGGISRKGVDCSGLTRLLYLKEGISLPHSAKLQFKRGWAVARSALLPGDLVFFNTRGPLSHVGIYIGNDKFLHAANKKRGVRVDNLDSPYYKKRFAGARRYKSFG